MNFLDQEILPNVKVINTSEGGVIEDTCLSGPSHVTKGVIRSDCE